VALIGSSRQGTHRNSAAIAFKAGFLGRVFVLEELVHLCPKGSGEEIGLQARALLGAGT
jgi:hypothetical protein